MPEYCSAVHCRRVIKKEDERGRCNICLVLVHKRCQQSMVRVKDFRICFLCNLSPDDALSKVECLREYLITRAEQKSSRENGKVDCKQKETDICNIQNDRKLQDDKKRQDDIKIQDDRKLQDEKKRQDDMKIHDDRTLQDERKFQNDRELQDDSKVQNDRNMQDDKNIQHINNQNENNIKGDNVEDNTKLKANLQDDSGNLHTKIENGNTKDSNEYITKNITQAFEIIQAQNKLLNEVAAKTDRLEQYYSNKTCCNVM